MVQPFLPNEADAFHTNQAEPDSVDFEILLLGHQRTGVVTGCAVTESGTPAQTVDVAVGEVALNGTRITVAVQADVAVSAADGSNPRIDLITVNSSGTAVVTAGTPAAQPVLPAIPASSVPLATLYIAASDNTHADNQINDKRVIVLAGPGGAEALVATSTSPAASQSHADYLGDGTDDEVQIQAAIDAVSAAGGGIVTLAEGTFTCNSAGASSGSVQIKDNVFLKGQGIGATIVKLRDTHGSAVTGIIRTPSGVININCGLADLTIDGNKANNGASGNIDGYFAGVTPAGGQSDEDIYLYRVEVQNCTRYGFDPHEEVTRLMMVNCIAHDNDQDGFVLDFVREGNLVGCQSFDNGRHGFNIVTTTRDVTFTGCVAHDNTDQGFNVTSGSTRLRFIGCLSHTNTLSGFYITPTGTEPQIADVLLSGCSIYDNDERGIRFRGDVTNCTVTGSTIRDNSAGAGNFPNIEIEDDGVDACFNIAIVGNTVTGTAPTYAIEEESGTPQSDNNLIVGNVIGAGATGTIFVNGPATLVRNNMGAPDNTAQEAAAATTLTPTDPRRILNVDSSGGAVVITLPDVNDSSGNGFMIRRDGSNTVTIDRAGADTFDDGDIQKTLDSDSAAIGIFSIGDTEWKIVGTEGTVGGS